MSDTNAVRVSSAEQLFATLEGGDIVLALAGLRAVGASPEAALAYGSHEGRDVVDVLVGLSRLSTGTTSGAAVAVTLVAFGDPRSRAELRRLWRETDDEDTLRAVASAAEVWPREEAVAALRGSLFDEDGLRVSLAAKALAPADGLTPRESLRISVATGRIEPPVIDATTVHMWAEELDGQFASDAIALVDRIGEAGVTVMLDAWEALGPGARIWVLARAGQPLGRALADRHPEVRDAALAALAATGGAAVWREPLAELWRSGDSRVRLAVMRAGYDGLDWRTTLSDPDGRIRAASLRCLARDEGAAAAEEIAARLSDERWRMRAAASDALRLLGDAGVSAARPALASAHPEVRYAAAQVLIAAGAWNEVEDALLGV